jgi:dsRNA-specific ribonuclease
MDYDILDPQNFERWKTDLLNELFRRIITYAVATKNLSEEIREAFSNENAQKLFVAAFTHPTVNPNRNGNYETLEFRGDAALELAFDIYLFEKFPNLSESEAHIMVNYYMASTYQPIILFKFGLTKFIRSKVPITESTYEDVFEALAGAMFLIGEQNILRGSGYSFVYNLLRNYFEVFAKNDLSLEKAKEHPKTSVKNIFDKIRLTDSKTNINILGIPRENEDGSWTLKLSLKKNMWETLKIYAPQIPIVLGESKKQKKDEAIRDAYSQALQVLLSNGLTRERVDQINRELLLSTNPDLYGPYEKARNKAKKEGYSDLLIEQKKNENWLALIGVLPSGEKVSLDVQIGSYGDALSRALSNYLSK